MSFFISGRKYAITLDEISAIERNDKNITQLPKVNPAILGVTNIRGRLCSVIDLKYILLNEKNTIDASNKLILFEKDDLYGAFLVDETDNIIEVSPSNKELITENGVDIEVIKINSEIIILLNKDELIEKLNGDRC